MDQRPITICVNGITYNREVETRRTLADFLRIDLQLTGTHVGCEHGVCGACTVLFNGNTARMSSITNTSYGAQQAEN